MAVIAATTAPEMEVKEFDGNVFIIGGVPHLV